MVFAEETPVSEGQAKEVGLFLDDGNEVLKPSTFIAQWRSGILRIFTGREKGVLVTAEAWLDIDNPMGGRIQQQLAQVGEGVSEYAKKVLKSQL